MRSQARCRVGADVRCDRSAPLKPRPSGCFPSHLCSMPVADFSTLQHAYGSAGDIPALLERARTAPAPDTYRDEPWFSLWSSLCHQGDVYTASYAAVPELVEIAAVRAAETRVVWECLLLAGSIELERALPEAMPPPPIPPELVLSYTAALRRGAEIASAKLAGPANGELQRGFALSYSAFSGDVAEARRLTNDAEVESAE